MTRPSGAAKRQPEGPAARDVGAELLDIVRAALIELQHDADAASRIRLDQSLDRDLGFDSLARVELLQRIEEAFGVHLGEEVLASAETPAHLLAALRKALASAGRTAPHPRIVARRAAAALAGLETPEMAATLTEALQWHVERHAAQVQIIHTDNGADTEITYGTLWNRAGAVAAGLQARGLAPKQTVAIMLPTGPDYFYTYYGILLAGGIPVPIYPPARLSQVEDHVRRHAGILSNAETVLLVTVTEARRLAQLLKARVPALRAIVTAAELMEPAEALRAPPAQAADIAFLQYTSGSTGNPKGVILTHANLLANIRAMGKLVKFTPQDVIVSWLPLYHDMGLISAWLSSLYFGRRIVVMSPMAFLARPARWLWAIHEHRGTLSAAPNFAYELCIKRIKDEDLQGLDLSSWRMACNGAEQVNPDTMERFQRRFAPYGLRPEALMPVYGLAECTVGLCGPPPGRKPVIDRVRREPFMQEGRALKAGERDANPLRFAACGRPLAGHHVRIVDDAGRELGERREGRLEFKGPSATQGYFRNPEATRKLFDGDWLDSGDRAYLADGEVHITGRVKDIVIRGGRHIYPDELEQVIGALPGVRKGCVAVFGSASAETGTERLVVLAETRVSDPAEQATLRGVIKRAAVDLLGEPPDEIVLAPPQTVLKTSSGKLRRAATRDLYESGRVGSRTRAPWWQVVRLVITAAAPELRRALARSAEWLYAARFWAALCLVAVPGWLTVAATRTPSGAWAVARLAARVIFALAGIPVTVRGLEHLRAGRTVVMVANHSSYLDGLALAMALPVPCAFVAKKELRGSFIARVFLDRLGAAFVERFDIRESVEDARRVTDLVAGGRSALYFPEGTFRGSAGLLPFHLGAFVTAVRTRAPVLPVALAGARAILRDDDWLAHRGAITVTIAPPVEPAPDIADTLAAAVRLRDLARAQILAACGEPDLGAREP